MTSSRVFHRRRITVEVLSEAALSPDLDLAAIHELITTGACSGQVNWGDDLLLDAKEAAKALQAQGSDPEFFRLTPDGSDSDET